MRTHKKHGILVAGINGFKIYIKNDHYRIVARYQHLDVTKDDESIVARYANLKYQPINERERIVSDFLKLTEGLI